MGIRTVVSPQSLYGSAGGFISIFSLSLSLLLLTFYLILGRRLFFIYECTILYSSGQSVCQVEMRTSAAHEKMQQQRNDGGKCRRRLNGQDYAG